MTPRPELRTFRRLWWLHPAWLFATVIGGTILVAAIQTDAAYRLYGAPKFLTAKHLLLAGAAIAVFALGRRLAEATGRIPRSTPVNVNGLVRLWFWITFALTLFGYGVWLGV